MLNLKGCACFCVVRVFFWVFYMVLYGFIWVKKGLGCFVGFLRR